MSLIQYYRDLTGRHLGTFISTKLPNGNVKFGWSKYNQSKESKARVPFVKKIGKQEAEKALNQQITLDIANSTISKGDVVIKNQIMVNEALEFVYRLRRFYGKSPENLTVIYDINQINEGIERLFHENKRLKIELRENDEYIKQLESKLNLLDDKMATIVRQIID